MTVLATLARSRIASACSSCGPCPLPRLRMRWRPCPYLQGGCTGIGKSVQNQKPTNEHDIKDIDKSKQKRSIAMQATETVRHCTCNRLRHTCHPIGRPLRPQCCWERQPLRSACHETTMASGPQHCCHCCCLRSAKFRRVQT